MPNRRVAQGHFSMPCVTTENTMVPCVIIGDRAAEILQVAYNFE